MTDDEKLTELEAIRRCMFDIASKPHVKAAAMAGDLDDSPSFARLVVLWHDAQTAATAELHTLRQRNARLVEGLRNARYSLEYWERECRVAGKNPKWAVGPYERGLQEIDRSRQVLEGWQWKI